MTKQFLIGGLLSLSMFQGIDASETKPAMDAKQERMMKAWKEYSTPGAPHQVLNDLVGKWKYTSKHWMAANAPVEESTGTSQMKLIMGGRFLEYETKGKEMGMPFEGRSLMGYDNIKATYDSIWFSNLGTGVMHGTANFDSASRTFLEKGEYTCPMAKNKKRAYRTEWKIIDKNNTVMSMFIPGDDGKEFKQMEISFKRS